MGCARQLVQGLADEPAGCDHARSRGAAHSDHVAGRTAAGPAHAVKFSTAIERSLGEEGGYTFNPRDPGGETNWGITWPILKQGIADGIVPRGTTIKNLTRPQAIALYEEYFWKAVNADALYDGVAYQALDFAINSGVQTAIRALQRALDVADDGRFGPISRKAAK